MNFQKPTSWQHIGILKTWPSAIMIFAMENSTYGDCLKVDRHCSRDNGVHLCPSSKGLSPIFKKQLYNSLVTIFCSSRQWSLTDSNSSLNRGLRLRPKRRTYSLIVKEDRVCTRGAIIDRYCRTKVGEIPNGFETE